MGTVASVIEIIMLLEQLLQAATGSKLTVLSEGTNLLKQNEELINLVVSAASGGKLSQDEVMKAIKTAIDSAFDAKVRAEMGLV
jgi:hypothetical protein